MGFDKYPPLWWLYLILAIMVSTFSLIYWVYKFSQWWKRRKRRHARQQRSRLERQEKLAALEFEREQLRVEREEVEVQLASAGAVSRLWHKRFYQSKLQEFKQREEEIAAEMRQLGRRG